MYQVKVKFKSGTIKEMIISKSIFIALYETLETSNDIEKYTIKKL